MLTLEDLLTKIAGGPVGDTALGGASSGTIPPASLPQLGVKIDAALLRLFTLFPLLVKTIELVTFAGRYQYPLLAKYALTDPGAEPQRFILDSAGNPFLGDVLAVERVLDSEHNPLPLNNREDCTSWFTGPAPTVLSMDYPADDARYFIEYRARHPKVDVTVADASTVAIEIPDVAENALLAAIAIEVFRGLNSDTALVQGQRAEALFTAECVLLDDRNSLNQHNSSSNCKPALGGWI